MRIPNTPHSEAVALGVKIWTISDIDVGSANFECNFYAFLDWIDPAAVDLKEGSIINPPQPGDSERCLTSVPEVFVKNAIAVITENKSLVTQVDGVNGHVSCRSHYHVRVYNETTCEVFPSAVRSSGSCCKSEMGSSFTSLPIFAM